MAWLGLRDFPHRLPEWRSEVIDMCVNYLSHPVATGEVELKKVG